MKMPVFTPAAKRELKGLAARLAAFGAGAWLLLGVVFGVGSVQNGDMHPTMEAGDVYFYYRLQTKWHAGDLVCAQKEGKVLVGRVAAQAGDRVEITPAGEVLVNGSRVVENDIHTDTPAYEGGPEYPVQLGEGELFLLCDERLAGADSRLYGPVSAEECRGKILVLVRRNNL